eukprot:3526672-Rhodomonas_salina.2
MVARPWTRGVHTLTSSKYSSASVRRGGKRTCAGARESRQKFNQDQDMRQQKENSTRNEWAAKAQAYRLFRRDTYFLLSKAEAPLT